MQIEEAIKRCNRRIKELKLHFAIDNLDLEAIETVLNELEEQTESNKELNKVIIIYKAMINEMAEEIAGHNHYESLGKLEDKEEVIDYYFKKVSDNK